jgi:MFS family permease
MPAVGAFVTALVLAQLPDLQKVGYKMFIAVAIFGLATIGFGLSTNFYLSLFFLTILGAADMVNVFIRSTIVQIETPDEMRGRVSAVNSLFIGASNELGEFESGVLAGFVGAVPSVIIGGIGSLLITLLWARWFPKLRERNQLSS